MPRYWRAAAAAGLVAVAVLHVAAAGDEWEDARGLFWLFIALAAACLIVAGRLAFGLDRWARPAVLVLALTPIAGYILSRSTGLPGASDDVGDWGNALGIASLVVEAGLVALATWPRPARLPARRTASTRSARPSRA